MMTWGSYVSLAELASSPNGFGEDRADIVSPMREAFVVRLDANGQRGVRRMRWGLVPSFAKDPGIGSRFIHARAETIDTTNAYKEAFRHRRGLVIASEFYEARHVTPTKREPHRMRMEDGSAVALAGIWETWKQPHDAPLETFAIVTVAANAAIAPVHDRMPAVLAESDWPKWLGETPATYEELKAMLRPCEDAITVTPVSPAKAPPPPRPSTQFDLF